MIQPYSESITFLAIDITANADRDDIALFKETNGYNFAFGTTDPTTLQTYEVQSQATKIAINDKGVIIFREGYGLLSEAEWLSVFDMLAL